MTEEKHFQRKTTSFAAIGRLKMLIILLVAVFVNAGTIQLQAQNNLSLNLQDVTLEQAISSIEKQTDYRFLYNKSLVDATRRVSVSANNQSIEAIVRQLLQGTGIGYTITDRQIVLQPTTTSSQFPAQSIATRQIAGKIVDAVGEPVIGATVVVKGDATKGTVTDYDGNFTLPDVPQNATISISYVGYKAVEFPANSPQLANLVLKEDSELLDEVVVTALGISRKEKNLSYAAQSISGESLAGVQELNVANSLSGKIAGLDVSSVSSGLGGSSKISLRGNRSIAGNNSALIVVDGVPIDNTSSTTRSRGSDGRALTGGFDSGDGISSINPADIESISVLKGASGSALYGSRASNGVIIITTKKGSAGKGLGVNFSSSFSTDMPNILLDLQNEYGQGSAGIYNGNTLFNWGPKMDGQMVDTWSNNPNYTGPKQYAFSPQANNVKDFFDNGMNLSNSLGVSIGGEKVQTRISANNDYSSGIVPNNTLNRTSLTTRISSQLSEKIDIDAKLSYMNQKINGRPWTGENIFNPVRQIYSIPRNISSSSAKDFEFVSQGANIRTLQHFWLPGGEGLSQNPYWVINRNVRNDERNKIQALASVKYQIVDGLSLMLRSSVDYYHDAGEFKLYNDTYQRAPNGDYIVDSYDSFELNNDFLLVYNKRVNDDWQYDINFGGSLFEQRRKGSNYSNTELLAENLFSQSNAKALVGSNSLYRRKLNSLYGFAQVTYKSFLTLDVTGRNDWSSTLPKANFSYFYPSVGLSAVFSDLLQMPQWFDFAKARVSYAQVGNDTDPFIINQSYTYISGGNNGFIYRGQTLPALDLKPEKTSSYEAGIDLRFLGNRLGVDLSWYKTNTFNQLISVPMPLPSGYSNKFINAGNVQNIGYEVKLYGTPIETRDFSWDTQFNFSTNQNKIIELTPEIKTIRLSPDDFIVSVVAEEGGAFGDIYVRGLQRNDKGDALIGANGLPLLTSQKTVKVGNSSPKWVGGWSNTFKYKNLSVNVLLDTKQGFDVVSFTDAVLTGYGLTSRTLDGRNGKLVIPGVLQDGTANAKEISSEALWTVLGGRNNPVGEKFVYDGSFIRLREISLSYRFSDKLIEKTPLTQIGIGVYGKNLGFLQNNAKIFDPEATIGTTSNQAVEAFGLPATRSFGINVNISF